MIGRRHIRSTITIFCYYCYYNCIVLVDTLLVFNSMVDESTRFPNETCASWSYQRLCCRNRISFRTRTYRFRLSIWTWRPSSIFTRLPMPIVVVFELIRSDWEFSWLLVTCHQTKIDSKKWVKYLVQLYLAVYLNYDLLSCNEILLYYCLTYVPSKQNLSLILTEGT